MKQSWTTWALPLFKWALAAVILVFVGRQFYRDLGRPELADISFRPGWLIACGVLYLLALGFSLAFWVRLLRYFGERPSAVAAVRAYYLGHFGKYVPGKAWALFLRGTLATPDVRFGVAVVTALYEVLTTMASGALVAAVVFLFDPPQVSGLEWPPVLTGLLLLGLCGVPLLPAVFNFLTRRVAKRFDAVAALNLPPVGFVTLLEGLALTACGWGVLGLSVWTLLHGMLPQAPAWDLGLSLYLSAATGLAYVAGFLAFIMPSGVGVREFFLLRLLAYLGPEGLIAAAVLLLRLVWTAAELVLAGFLFFLGRKRVISAP
ncbi:MAG: lysylphosphatidylglycerol synthase domain-containing protein [Gemmataceae bacterium]|nr:lysylphosphatidylglycerol synthase domain-containing protein [Gemmataceae bacterium]MCI0740180.1 lysylphosphatidylglycerol synthase domain-containing protein [Gemmataceae bacterium]